MQRVLVIGYGNTLRGDDGVGVVAASRLAEEYNTAEVQVIVAHQLTPELAETISHYQRIIFIDATQGSMAGQEHFYMLTPEAASGRALTHHSTPQELLFAAHELYEGQAQGVLFSVTGEDFDYGEGLSTPVQKILPILLDNVRQLITCYLEETE